MKPILLITAAITLICTTSCQSFHFPEIGQSGIRTKNITELDVSVDFNSFKYMNLLKTMPNNGTPKFFAYVSRKGNREDELALCLLNAAAQASSFHSVTAVSKFYSRQINSSIKYAEDLDISWDTDLAVALIDHLEVNQIIQDHDGTYMVVELKTASVNPEIRYTNIIQTEEPSWVLHPPDIPGYITGVGTVLQKGQISKSFKAADDQALEEIVRQISTLSRSSKKQIENSMGTAAINDNIAIAEASVRGFYVIERWYTPDKRYYHTLAVAPVSNRVN